MIQLDKSATFLARYDMGVLGLVGPAGLVRVDFNDFHVK